MDGCTESCNGVSIKIAIKEKFSASTVEAGTPALQSEFDSPTNENSAISGVLTAGGLRAEKQTGKTILKPPKSR